MFQSYSGHLELGPPSCAFISENEQTEGTIMELLHSSASFDTVFEVLKRAGLRLEPMSDEELSVLPCSAVALRATVSNDGEDGLVASKDAA